MSSAASNPLLDLHQTAEAELQAYDGIEIVSTFGQPQAEYAAIHKGCGIMDLPQRGILEAHGRDRIDFLNRFLTNQLVQKDTKISLAAGEGVYAYLLSNKGRIVADVNVLEHGDHAWLETDARNIEPLKSTLTKYVFTEKVEFVSRAGQLHQMALHGPRAIDILRQIQPEFAELTPLGSARAQLFDIDLCISRDDTAGVPGYGLIVPVESAPALWTQIIVRFGAPDGAVQQSKRQVWPVGWAAFNATRIEAGRPLFGIDFDSNFLPAETGQLARAVSFTKGCYLGQEIVARMHARGQMARQIVGIKMATDALPIAGATVFDAAQNQVGGITSSTMSPVLSNAAICLGVVKSAFAAVGTEVLLIPAEGAIRKASVVELPFYKSGVP